MMICTAGSLLCIFYYIALVIHNRYWQFDFAFIWLVFGIILAAIAALLKYESIYGKIIPSWMKIAAGVLAVLFLIVVICLGSLVVRGMISDAPEDLEYVIILGAHVRGETPSKALKKRIDRAYEYVQKNENAILILAGGQGIGEDISEAECMRRYLKECGISEEKMVLEDRSTSTRENLIFSNRLTGCYDKKTGLVSNDFHIYRALYLAKNLGYTDTYGIAAPTDRIAIPNYVLREVLALIKARLLKRNTVL